MVEVSVEDLGIWAASSVFEGLFGAPAGKIDGTARISVKPVEVQSVLVGGTEYRLVRTHMLPFFDQSKGGTVGRIRDTVSIRVAPAESFPMIYALQEASLIQDLISLAMHRAAGVIWVRLEVAGTESLLSDDRIMPRRHANLLYSPAALGKYGLNAAKLHHALFTCDSLPFEEVFPRWTEVHGRLHAATNMILGLRYAPARFVENNLLTAVGAAEVLHCSLGIDEKPFPKAVFAEIREEMLARVPVEHRGRFKGATRNDPTLRDRLYALAERPDQQAIARFVPDVSHWARRTTQARNDLTHEGRTPTIPSRSWSPS